MFDTSTEASAFIFTHIIGVLELCLVLLPWNAIAAFSEECVAKIFHRSSVATLLSS